MEREENGSICSLPKYRRRHYLVSNIMWKIVNYPKHKGGQVHFFFPLKKYEMHYWINMVE